MTGPEKRFFQAIFLGIPENPLFTGMPMLF